MNDPTQIRPPRGSAAGAVALLCLCALAALAGVGISFGMLGLVKQAESGVEVSQEQWGGLLALAGLQAVGYLGLVLFTGVFFMVWLYKAVSYARFIAPEANQTSPAWATWSFIVPIANLFVPVRATYAAYTSCHVAEHFRRTGQSIPPAGGIVALWWCAWLLMGIVNNVANNVGELDPFAEGSTAEAVRSAWQAYLAAQVVSAFAAVIAATVVMKLTGVQTRLAAMGVGGEADELVHSPGGLPGMPVPGAAAAPAQKAVPRPAPSRPAPAAAPAISSRPPLPGMPPAGAPAPVDEAPQFMPGIPPPPPPEQRSEAA